MSTEENRARSSVSPDDPIHVAEMPARISTIVRKIVESSLIAFLITNLSTGANFYEDWSSERDQR